MRILTGGGDDVATLWHLAVVPDGDSEAGDEAVEIVRPGLITWEAPGVGVAPPIDSYSIRLIARRKLYDQATNTQMAPSLAGLVDEARLFVNPALLRRMGIDSGARANVTSSRTTVVLPLVADDVVPDGVAVMSVRPAGTVAAELIDLRAPVTELRIESR